MGRSSTFNLVTTALCMINPIITRGSLSRDSTTSWACPFVLAPPDNQATTSHHQRDIQPHAVTTPSLFEFAGLISGLFTRFIFESGPGFGLAGTTCCCTACSTAAFRSGLGFCTAASPLFQTCQTSFIELFGAILTGANLRLDVQWEKTCSQTTQTLIAESGVFGDDAGLHSTASMHDVLADQRGNRGMITYLAERISRYSAE